MSIQDGDQFFQKDNFNAAIRAYNNEIKKYADPEKYPNSSIDYYEIATAIKKRADVYAEKAKRETDLDNREHFATKAICDYTTTIALHDKSSSDLYQDCENGIALMNKL